MGVEQMHYEEGGFLGWRCDVRGEEQRSIEDARAGNRGRGVGEGGTLPPFIVAKARCKRNKQLFCNAREWWNWGPAGRWGALWAQEERGGKCLPPLFGVASGG